MNLVVAFQKNEKDGKQGEDIKMAPISIYLLCLHMVRGTRELSRASVSRELISFMTVEPHECVLVTQSCLTLSDPTDYSLPGSSVHGIL